jgi:hypothetical protein
MNVRLACFIFRVVYADMAKILGLRAKQKSLVLAQEAFLGGGRPGIEPVVLKTYFAGT